MLPMTPVYMLYFVPLLVAFVFVFAGTRHEQPRLILQQAWHTACWILVFMGAIFAILWALSLFL